MKRRDFLKGLSLTALSLCLPDLSWGHSTRRPVKPKQIIGKAKANNVPVYAQGEPPYGDAINHLYKEQKVVALSPANEFGMIPVIVVLPYQDGRDYEEPIPASDFFAPDPDGYVRAKDIKGLPEAYYKLPPKHSAPPEEEPEFTIPVSPIPNAVPHKPNRRLIVELMRSALQKRFG